MKHILVLACCVFCYGWGMAQTLPEDVPAVLVENDSSRLAVLLQKTGLVYTIPRRFTALAGPGDFVVEKKEVTCYPSAFVYMLYDRRTDLIIGLNFQEISRKTGDMVRETVPDFDENANYLGNEECRRQRETGWLSLLKASDMRKVNADSLFSFTVPARDFEPYKGKYEARIVTVLHKKDRADITIEYFYHPSKERRVRREIRRLGEMLRFK